MSPSPCSIAGDAYLVDAPVTANTTDNLVVVFSGTGNVSTTDRATYASWLTRSTGASNLRSAAYNATLQRFVVVGTNSGAYAAMNNLASWTTFTLPTALTNPRVVAGANFFVIADVGSSNNYYTSANGMTWTARSLPAGNTIQGIALDVQFNLGVCISAMSGTTYQMWQVTGDVAGTSLGTALPLIGYTTMRGLVSGATRRATFASNGLYGLGTLSGSSAVVITGYINVGVGLALTRNNAPNGQTFAGGFTLPTTAFFSQDINTSWAYGDANDGRYIYSTDGWNSSATITSPGTGVLNHGGGLNTGIAGTSATGFWTAPSITGTWVQRLSGNCSGFAFF